MKTLTMTLLATVVLMVSGPHPGADAAPAGLAPRLTLPMLSRASEATLAGTWGGEHVSLVVDAGGTARLEFDCANGIIRGPLFLDESGRFSWTGAYIREHGGPIREDELPEIHPAMYSGTVADRTMKLSIVLTDTGDDAGSFVLEAGSGGRVLKCL